MSQMANFSKAYAAERFREYQGWSEKTAPATVSAGEEGAEDHMSVEYYFLHDNYVVTSSIFTDEEVAFDAVTDDWKNFCHEVLRFDPTGLEVEAENNTQN